MRRVLATLLLAAAATAQQPNNPTTQQPATPGQYVGVASCANSGCHGATTPLQATRIRQNEYFTWLHSDRHAGAYNVLFNPVSARIARNMKLAKKPYQEKLCLDCHSSNVAPAMISGRIDIEDGVQCETCHGPASGWRGEHAQQGWTHAQSVERGMIDLRDTRVRGHICDSCHVGSNDKDVDHDLIASGHPFLAFELDNYTETMPPHWNPNETHGVPAWAVGQAMAFRDSMTNLARHARGEKWPEFSDMSCYNCHHALKTGQWRQERGWPGRPGLPAWSPQRWAVLRLIVPSSDRPALDDAVSRVASRVSRMSPDAASAADDARRLIESAIPKIYSRTWSVDDVRPMVVALTSERDTDVHAAEQRALALQTLATVLTRRDNKIASGALMKAIDALFADLKDRDDYDPARFGAKLDAVRAAL
jgi:hypothetical protein